MASGLRPRLLAVLGSCEQTGAHALAIFMMSDHLRTGEATTSEERQSTFADMIEIALHVATDT